MNTHDLEEFEQWVERNATPSQERAATELSSRALTALALSATSQPVVANSKLTGPDAQQVLQADQAYILARNANDPVLAEQKLAASPATGCAMCLSLAQIAAGYNPADPSAAGNLAGFLAYVQEIMRCPIFVTTLNDTVDIAWQSDWNSIVNAIASYYVGISDDEKATIGNSLWTLARAAASNPNTNQTDNLFVQSTLNSDSGNLGVYIYKSSVLVREERHRGSGKNAPTRTADTASLTLYRTVLSFQTAGWPAYSKIIMPKTNASLSSWLTDNSTPQGTVPVDWNC